MKSIIGGSQHGKFTSKTVKNREKILWHDEVYVKKEAVSSGVKLYFSFNIPENLPESGVSSVSGNHWKLDIESEGGQGIILNRSFIIPVYGTNRMNSL